VIRMVILTDQPTERLIFYPDEYQSAWMLNRMNSSEWNSFGQ
jgi:hypothetical protein